MHTPGATGDGAEEGGGVALAPTSSTDNPRSSHCAIPLRRIQMKRRTIAVFFGAVPVQCIGAGDLIAYRVLTHYGHARSHWGRLEGLICEDILLQYGVVCGRTVQAYYCNIQMENTSPTVEVVCGRVLPYNIQTENTSLFWILSSHLHSYTLNSVQSVVISLRLKFLCLGTGPVSHIKIVLIY